MHGLSGMNDDPELMEAMARSMADTETKPSLPPPGVLGVSRVVIYIHTYIHT